MSGASGTPVVEVGEGRAEDLRPPLPAHDIKTACEFERFLRQHGFSRAKARAIASKGWKAAALTHDDSNTNETAELRAALEIALRQLLQKE